MLEGFPHVTHANCIPHSPPTEEYNCVGWAVHSQQDFIWPDAREQFSWPLDLPRDESVGNMTAFFVRLGFVDCIQNTELEAGFEKVAIYGDQDGAQHVARQLTEGADAGRWTSKMGEKLDVIHSTPAVLNDFIFGTVRVVMKRRFAGQPPPLPPLHPPRPILITPSGGPLLR